MKDILLILFNIVIVSIVWIILNSKINKNSLPSRIEEYTREVERLIVELNRALDEVVSISEERVKELKSMIKKAEKVVKKGKTGALIEGKIEEKVEQNVEDNAKIGHKTSLNAFSSSTETKAKVNLKNADLSNRGEEKSFVERVRYLSSMGYSRKEIASALGITPAEVDFLLSLSIRKT